MRFEPKSDQELYGLLEKGNYDFEVIDAKDTESKSSGRPMLAVTLKVFGPDKGHTLKDYIVEGGKLKRLCESVGMMTAYNAGDLPAIDLVGACGQCKVDIEQSEQFGDRNRISGYVPQAKAASATAAAPKAPAMAGVPASQQRAANAAQAARNDPSEVPF